MEPSAITPPLKKFEAFRDGRESVLPTGRLKVENGALFQEAEVITHNGPDVGVRHVWFPVIQTIADALRQSTG
jgi:hypothetical protein